MYLIVGEFLSSAVEQLASAAVLAVEQLLHTGCAGRGSAQTPVDGSVASGECCVWDSHGTTRVHGCAHYDRPRAGLDIVDVG
jgi:hypothetical protein